MSLYPRGRILGKTQLRPVELKKSPVDILPQQKISIHLTTISFFETVIPVVNRSIRFFPKTCTPPSNLSKKFISIFLFYKISNLSLMFGTPSLLPYVQATSR